MIYQPWSGQQIAGGMNVNRKSLGPNLEGYVNSVIGMQGDTRGPLLTMASDHDSIRPFKELTVEGIGAHHGQFALEVATTLVKQRKLKQKDMLEFMLFHELSIETLTMFSGRHGYLSTGHLLRLGNWEEKNGWQVVFKAKNHPDLNRLAKVTENTVKQVEETIDRGIKQLNDLRKLFLNSSKTSIVDEKIFSTIKIKPYSINKYLFAVERSDKNHRTIILFNFLDKTQELPEDLIPKDATNIIGNINSVKKFSIKVIEYDL
jgi:hypothetical protein